jgi:FAD/FMN-containing dehydrogenase
MDEVELKSWGGFAGRHTVLPLFWREDVPFAGAPAPFLAYGLGRSYGDSCLNDGGTLLTTRRLDRFIALDERTGILRCEAGVSFEEILAFAVPRGFYLPVVPGTKLVTVGGAIANDVHGKNHHRAGTFGAHVRALELLRSSGERLECSPAKNPALFAATIGGLGLTGLILSAEVQLRRISSAHVAQESIPLRNLEHFFEVAAESDVSSEFTVAWIDCLARGDRLGRGIFYRGDFAEGPPVSARAPKKGALRVPFELPFSPLNRATLAVFNGLYHAKNRATAGRRLVHHEPFFFPLDGIQSWNRIYGRKGLLQFQCAVPKPAAPVAMRELLGAISAAGDGSFLAVLKNFGPVPSPGLLSFPRDGVTLALDFPNRGEKSARLFAELYATVLAHGGRLYPAKDALMSGAQFRAQYAEVLPAFTKAIDPAFSSSFWRRVSAP